MPRYFGNKVKKYLDNLVGNDALSGIKVLLNLIF